MMVRCSANCKKLYEASVCIQEVMAKLAFTVQDDNTVHVLSVFTKDVKKLFEVHDLLYVTTMDGDECEIQCEKLLDKQYRIVHNNNTVRSVEKV